MKYRHEKIRNKGKLSKSNIQQREISCDAISEDVV